ncbi:MAG: C40 family peptidase [Bacteroidetes bacterium]|nr:C40 family peptidase [Bacteroidota bacterium]MBL6943699.1 C40 family peptidase [Bacteroidales bacterium]
MTKYGICEQSLVAVRNLPSDQSEMINQLIFGDLLIINDVKDQWYLINTLHDMYEGWVDIKQITPIEKHQFEKLKNNKPVFLSDIYAKATSQKGKSINLVLGSRLPNYKNNTITISDGEYLIEGNIQPKILMPTGQNIANIAMKYLGTPYLWGGRSPFGIDCSGFTQLVFSMIGIPLGRDTQLQVELGETINFINEANTGDLAFFDNKDERVTHVGIILNNKQIIHASGEVRIDNIDHHGIYIEEHKKYTHKLRVIKRIT